MHSPIDIKKSIETGWLIQPRTWFDKIEFGIFFVFPCAFLISLPVLIVQTKHPNANERPFVYFIFPLMIALSIYSIYRKIFENKLSVVETNLPQAQCHKILDGFIRLQVVDKIDHFQNGIITTKESSISYNDSRAIITTYIITDNRLFFNIVRKNPKISFPVFFQHFFLKHKLRKLFRE